MANETTANAVPMPHFPARYTPFRLVIAVVLAAIYWWSVVGAEFSPVELAKGLPKVWETLVLMFPPSIEGYKSLWVPFWETLYIGVLATFFGSIISIPVGFAASTNMVPWYIYHPVRMVLNIFRGVSEIIWALFFVVAVGLGPMPGVIALTIFSVGMLSKLLSEAVEASDIGMLEAMTATGASRWKVFFYGALPEVFPLYISYTLYYWDHNTRQATVLGFVGAGGLGVTLLWNMSMYEFEQATTVVIIIVCMITVIDRLCLKMREAIQ